VFQPFDQRQNNFIQRLILIDALNAFLVRHLFPLLACKHFILQTWLALNVPGFLSCLES
jgi:hypothetical protein